MPIIHDYESSTDSNDSNYIDEFENAFLSKCPECEEYRREDEINREKCMCYDCIESLREEKENEGK